MKGVIYMVYQDPHFDDPNKVYIVAEGENFEAITQFIYGNGDIETSKKLTCDLMRIDELNREQKLQWIKNQNIHPDVLNTMNQKIVFGFLDDKVCAGEFFKEWMIQQQRLKLVLGLY